VTVINKGKAAAQIGQVSAADPFCVPNAHDKCSSHTVNPGKSCSFEVEFSPVTVADVTGGMADIPNNGASAQVLLEGNGIAVKLSAPKKVTFPSVKANSTGKPVKISISNPSTVPVTMQTAQLGAPNAGSFTIVNGADHCSGQIIAAKKKCQLEAEFSPPMAASGAQSSPLSFGFTYGSNNGSVSIGLAGTPN